MPDKLTPKYELLVDGSPVPDEVLAHIVSITVRQDVVLANSIEVRLTNADLRYSDSDTFAEGKKVSVKLGYVETDIQLVGTGTIARRECEFPERGPAQITVVAYDKRFTLKHGNQTRAWKDSKDSDIVSELASKAGLSAEVDDTGFKHPYVFQVAQTDLAFIAARGMALGFIVHLDPECAKLKFKKPDAAAAPSGSFEWGKDLFSFRPRFTTADQMSAVTVRAYDMTKKKEIKGKATPDDLLSSMGLGRIGPAAAQKAHGQREVLITAPVRSEDEAKDMAKAYMNQAAQGFASASGTVQGDNKVGAGCVVELKALGGRASGKYYVHSTVHYFLHQGYTTYFECMRPGESPLPDPRPSQPASGANKGPGQEGGFGAQVGHATQDGSEGAVTADVSDHGDDASGAGSFTQATVSDPSSAGAADSPGHMDIQVNDH